MSILTQIFGVTRSQWVNMSRWPLSKMLLIHLRFFWHIGLEARIFWENWVNTMAADVLASTGHQQPRYYFCTIYRSEYPVGKDFNYLSHLSVEEWYKMTQKHIFHIDGLVQERHNTSALTHWGRGEMDAISQKTFSNAFSWMKMYDFRLRSHWSLFPRFESIIFQHWFR